MARPLLADPDFAQKTRLGKADEINTCIACNQACLDRIFTERTATCLVNPRAGREIEFDEGMAEAPQRLAVVGGGPAGMAFAINAARRGHAVTLFEAGAALGGQLNLAKKVPGKAEFHELLRYFRVALERAGVTVHLGTRVEAAALAQHVRSGAFDEVVLATGVVARRPEIPGIDHAKVLSYLDVLGEGAPVGPTVAIVGAGGIGFDVAEFLVGDARESLDPQAFMAAWGVDPTIASAGGLKVPAPPPTPARRVHLFQRKAEALGKNLGKSTGWILKAKLRRAEVTMTAGAHYDAVDDAGLHLTVDGQPRVVDVDTIVLCAGQLPNRQLHDELARLGIPARLIGGADVAAELDALRAIDQATRLAQTL
ncbi:MAG TPA: FAD-dependent oxidoreductase, partial [Burkholderiaceae bacterium]|nr:FAD-dependent oxidoreductase [Burkholderiaceae bacterium]